MKNHRSENLGNGRIGGCSESGISTYQLCTNDVPVLGISLIVGILHKIIVLEDGLPHLLVFPVTLTLARELLDCDLVTVVILEYQVAEEGGFNLLLKFDINVALTRSLTLSANLT